MQLQLSSDLLACFADQTGNGWGQLCADAFPVSQAVLSDTEGFFLTGCNRVVETQTLDKATVAAIARISCNDVEEWALLGASTS
ncbi:hypothetical protein F506_17160 [Herbaspirillum hiltneri N3]|uniref:Uncharacterized protein n=1 Tax=Herbaspirillum hiltneri N3 TaxID=1262470 RepID=A0ABM5V3K9_9BURK|nr:hypothetical protein F506_17160 [Herbaspirillum hiltneri N3]